MFASLIVIAAAAAVLVAPGTASASNVNCATGLKPSADDPKSKYALDYSILCDQNLLGYSIVFNRQIDIFGPEVIALKPDGEASGELASCEGFLPGAGVGCTGKVAAGNTLNGAVETRKPYCATKRPRRGPLEAWLTVTTVQKTASGSDFTTSSQPFHLEPVSCPKPKTDKNKR